MNFFSEEKTEEKDLEEQSILDKMGLGYFKIEKEEEQSITEGMFELTKTQKIIGFTISLILGIFSLFLSTLFIPTILLTSRKFAFLYTIGNFLLVFSTTFIIGPKQQLKTMFDRNRIIPTLLYLTSTLLTLLFAIQVKFF
jgi:hypothetical protein